MNDNFGHLCGSNTPKSERYFGSFQPAAGEGSDWKSIVASVLQHLLLWPRPVSVILARDLSCTPGISICMSGWIYIAVYVSHWLCRVCSTGEPLHFLYWQKVHTSDSYSSHDFFWSTYTQSTLWIFNHVDRINYVSLLVTAFPSGVFNIYYSILT